MRLSAHATASESTGIIGLRGVSKSDSSFFSPLIHPWVSACLHVRALFVLCLLLLLHSVLAPRFCTCVSCFRCTCACLALHSNSWSDTVCSQGPGGEGGDDVGDCHDAANLQREGLFISPLFLLGEEREEKTMLLF